MTTYNIFNFYLFDSILSNSVFIVHVFLLFYFYLLDHYYDRSPNCTTWYPGLDFADISGGWPQAGVRIRGAPGGDRGGSPGASRGRALGDPLGGEGGAPKNESLRRGATTVDPRPQPTPRDVSELRTRRGMELLTDYHNIYI